MTDLKAPQDVFEEYELYLETEHWPRRERGFEIVEVSSMPPQQAASSLAKLMRWASTYPEKVGTGFFIHEMDAAVMAVRMTRLGRSLSARALNFITTEQFNEWIGVESDGLTEPESDEYINVAGFIATSLYSTNRLDVSTVTKVSVIAAQKLCAHYRLIRVKDA